MEHKGWCHPIAGKTLTIGSKVKDTTEMEEGFEGATADYGAKIWYSFNTAEVCNRVYSASARPAYLYLARFAIRRQLFIDSCEHSIYRILV
jgi:hypothetical protein